jgi:hypothetical protein
MSTINDPRPLTRKELALFLPSERAIRAFERLFDLIPIDLNEFTDYLEEIKTQPVNVSADYDIQNGNFIILVDASAGPIFNETTFDLLAYGEVINVIGEPSTVNWELAA